MTQTYLDREYKYFCIIFLYIATKLMEVFIQCNHQPLFSSNIEFWKLLFTKNTSNLNPFLSLISFVSFMALVNLIMEFWN